MELTIDVEQSNLLSSTKALEQGPCCHGAGVRLVSVV